MELALTALLGTLVVELAVVLVLVPVLLPKGERRTALAACASLNLVSHPLACAALPWLGWWSAEGLVLALEGAGYAGLHPTARWRAFALAALANLASACGSAFWAA